MENDREIISKLELLRADVGHVKEDVNLMRRFLIEGLNGKDPMIVRINHVEADVKALKEMDNEKKVPRAVWVSVVFSTVVGVAGVIAAIL